MFDTNLVLDAGQTVTNEAQTTAIQVEGGVLAWLCIKYGAMAGSSVGLTTRLQYRPDGTNWYTCPGGIGETLVGTSDNKFIRQPVFIPDADTKGDYVDVRLDYELSEDGDESYAVTKAWLEPMLGTAPPAVDRIQGEGLYIDLAKGTESLP